jgi:hypothetical protein
MSLSPLIRFGTSTWTYEGWQGQVYHKQYAKTTFARECLGEYCQYLYNGEPLFRTVGNDSAGRSFALVQGITTLELRDGACGVKRLSRSK